MKILLTHKIVVGAGDLVAGKTASFKDNLYLAVNGDWQATAEIPADKSSAGASSGMDVEIEKTLMDDFAKFEKDETSIDSPELVQAVKLYKLAKDTDLLKKFHQKPILKDLDRIESIKSLTELNENIAELAKNGFPLPLGIGIDADMKNTVKNVVYLDGADLILPDKSYYEDGNESGKKLLAKYAEVAKKLLIMVGYAEAAAQKLVDQTLAFDASLVPIVKSSEEWADDIKIYNPISFDDYLTKSKYLNLKSFIVDQINATPEKIIVMQPRYMDNLDKLVNDDTFENLKAWMLVSLVFDGASSLDEDFRQTVGEYRLAYTGAAELQSRTKFAYHLAENTFSEVVGVYYGQKYFGETAKLDVQKMVKQMIDIYEQRLAGNDWLSEDTKKKAVLKLQKMVIKVGYPDKIEAVYHKLQIDDSISLYDNLAQIQKVVTQYELDQYKQPVDRGKWLMPGQMVNACYNPTSNDITFPAGILKEPFYSLKQTVSENFGGIGATIAHEISHAFDNNGAQFDELGNINNWWTDEDYAKFKELTQAMIKEFEGIPFAGGKVNGTLVVSENIADIGGLRCALEAAKLDTNYNVKEFFISWAKTWRFKATQQLNERLLSMDVHAPQPLRANVHAQNLDEYYEAFDVQPGDGMWLDKDKRVNIW